MNKKIFLIGLGAIAIVVVSVILTLYINFRTSYRYTQYQFYMAAKKANSALALEYYDINKIVDNKISSVVSDELNDNPFAALGIAMIENMRPSLVNTLEKQIVESYETVNADDLPNAITLFWLAYNDKPINKDYIFEFKKINDKKVIKKEINTIDNSNTVYTMQKIDKKWVVTSVE